MGKCGKNTRLNKSYFCNLGWRSSIFRAALNSVDPVRRDIRWRIKKAPYGAADKNLKELNAFYQLFDGLINFPGITHVCL